MTNLAPIKCGIIGAGKIAWEYDQGQSEDGMSVTHAACFARHPQTQLVSVFDPNEKARQAFKNGYANSHSVSLPRALSEFLGQELDLISICSPNAFHNDHIRACLNTSIDFLWVEKPVTQTLKDFEGIVRLLKKSTNPPRINVNFFRRSLAQYAALKSAHAEQPAEHIEIIYSRTLETNGVHLMDILGYVTGQSRAPDIDWVQKGATPNPSFGLQIEDTTISVIGMDLPYHCIDIRATFQDKRISISKGGMEVKVERKVPNPSFPGFFHLEEAKDHTLKMGYDPVAEGTYLNLCNLLDQNTDLQSPLISAAFSQEILDALSQKRLT